MQLLAVPVYYDFASSICYVAHRVLQRLAPDLDRLGIELIWQPVDLTLFSLWRRGAEIRDARRDNVLRVSRELAVPLRLPERWPDSRPALAVALALAGSPAESSWRESVWSAVFEQGRTLDAPGELERFGADLRIDAAALVTWQRLEALEQRTLACIEAEVNSVPTFMFDGWPIGGIQDADTMRSLLARYAAKKRAAAEA